MGICDFSASFILWDTIGMPRRPDSRPYARHQPWGNSARLQIDALLDVAETRTGTAARYYLIAPCRTEWMYVDENIFARHPDHNREYRVIFSATEQLGVGKGLLDEAGTPRAQPLADTFNDVQFQIRTYRQSDELATPREVVEATHAGLPLVGRTEIQWHDGSQRAVLEYPIHTMNIHPPRERFQVDTGPLIVPDFDSKAERPIERLALAHVVYNRPDRAEFILRRPTPILKDGQEVCRVVDYTEVRAYAAQNRVFAAR